VFGGAESKAGPERHVLAPCVNRLRKGLVAGRESPLTRDAVPMPTSPVKDGFAEFRRDSAHDPVRTGPAESGAARSIDVLPVA